MDKNTRGLIGLIVGILLGVPVGYFFQSGMLRAKLSLGAYLAHLPELLAHYAGDVFPPLLLSCVVLAAVGWLVDFNFDLSDAHRIYCTELVWRSYQAAGLQIKTR